MSSARFFLSLVFILGFCAIFVKSSSLIFATANTPIPADTMLQATTVDFQSDKSMVWQGNFPVATQKDFSLDQITKLPVVEGPQRVLLIPQATINQSQLQQSNTPAAILQGGNSTTFQTSNINTANLLGNIKITNSNLNNSTVTINTGTGLSGGGEVALGSLVTLVNTGVTSIIGTANQVLSSASVGGITLSLPQSIDTSAVPTFSKLNLSGSTNQLVLGSNNTGILSWAPTDNRTLTLPDNTDTLIGKNTSDILTNKTLTAPVISTITNSGVITLPSGNDTLVGRSSADILTNKTINASSNTISELTNSNLSGGAGITNANLANPSITISTGSGISGSSSVSLGETLTLTNTGVLSLTGTSSQVSVSGSTGSITLSLPQNIGTDSNPSFSSLNLTSSSNQLTLGTNGVLSWSPSTTRTLTLPDTTDTLLGKNTSDTLTNKTINASSNTISNLTNSNLSGTANISNANLANSSINITPGTGLSGGGTVSLGASLSLTNAGVTSLSGTSNQVNISGATGEITLSLPQSVGTNSTPSFNSLSLTGSSNQLSLGTTNIGTISWTPTTTRTITFPDTTDTLVGKTTTDILTNKTLTAPAINGAVSTTGLTLPAFTASGSITGSGAPSISSFGSINGLILTANSIGFSLSGGTSSKTLTLSNSLTFAGTDSTTITFQGTDTYIGRTTADTLTNKTLTAPVINGIVTTSGLTLPSFTASGDIDQSGSTGTFSSGTGAVALNGTTTIASNKTLAVTTADKLTVGGNIIPQTVTITVPMVASLVDQTAFVADASYQISAVRCVYSVKASLNGALQITVDTGTGAPGTGTDQLSSSIDLSGTVNSVLNGTIVGSPTSISAGDRVGIDLSGTLLGLLGTCTITLKRV